MSEAAHRSGFVSIAGRPNAGKSTLLNALVGQKLAITAHQPQTTRTSIQGVLSTPQAQIIFIDTPGIHKSETLFNKRMMNTVRAALQDRDLVLFIADASKPIGVEDEQAVSGLLSNSRKTDAGSGAPSQEQRVCPPASRRASAPFALGSNTRAVLVANKIDRLEDKRLLLPFIQRYSELFPFVESVPVSARTGEGIDEVKRVIVEHLPEGPPLFPDDYLTDQPMRFLAAEIIREQILRAAREEVPHAVAVLIDEWEEKPNVTRIAATIHVERPGQKAILIGNKGQMLKKIGSEARRELESMLERKVFLSLYVKVKPNWREDPAFLDAVDWRSMVGSEDRTE